MPAAKVLSRLVEVYAVLERVREAEFRMAAFQEAELRREGCELTAHWQAHARGGRAALAQGDRLGLMVAQAEQHAAATRRNLLEERYKQSQLARSNAEMAHQHSRLQVEQVRDAVRHQRTAQERDDARRFQSAADDRFLARREWVVRNNRKSHQDEEDLMQQG